MEEFLNEMADDLIRRAISDGEAPGPYIQDILSTALLAAKKVGITEMRLAEILKESFKVAGWPAMVHSDLN